MAAINAGTEAGNVLFVEEAMRTLVEARQTLVASYAYGYFIVYTAKRKTFENLQVSWYGVSISRHGVCVS